MAGRMKNPSISDPEDGYISILVDDTYPANKKGVIVKGQKPKYFMKAGEYDELKGYLYFTVYEAGVLDTDKEFMKSEDLDFMHLDLMKNMRSTKLADINHDQKRLENVWLMEIWKDVDKEGNTIAIKGAYYIKDNEYLMGKAKEGKINGVSIMGRVEDIVDEPLSKNEEITLMKKLKLLFSKSTLADFEEMYGRDARAWWIDRIWSAFHAFRKNTIRWDESLSEDELIVTKEQYDKEVDEFAVALKSIEFGELFKKSNNEEYDMTKEEIANMTDEQLKELNLQRIDGNTDGNTDDQNSADNTTDDGSTDGSTDELENVKSELQTKSDELTKLTTEFDTLKTEHEKLKSDFEELRKMKKSNDAENGDKKKEPQITKEQWDKLDAFDKHNFKIEYPEFALKFENNS